MSMRGLREKDREKRVHFKSLLLLFLAVSLFYKSEYSWGREDRISYKCELTVKRSVSRMNLARSRKEKENSRPSKELVTLRSQMVKRTIERYPVR